MEPEGSGSSNSGAVEPKGRMRVEGVSAMGIELARIWAGASEEVNERGRFFGSDVGWASRKRPAVFTDSNRLAIIRGSALITSLPCRRALTTKRLESGRE